MNSTSERIVWRPYTQEKIAPAPKEIARAEGAYLYTRDGRKIFDGISSWWVITHGHCHPGIVEGIQRQASRLDQVIFANFTHQPAERLAEALVALTPPKLSRVFYTDNGSTAVESALKMALQACAQRGQPERTRFLAFEKSYHGDTVGAMSVNGESLFTRPYRPTLFPVLRARQPESIAASAAEYVADFERLMAEHHQHLAGVILEPLIQAAGGMIFWPQEAVQRIAVLCERHGVYLIFDEVMTGFGRTGSLFAMDQLGVTPDLLCLSKGLTAGSLPLAATMASEEIYRAFWADEKAKMFFHGHSFTGNPIACAAALANLEIFRETDVLAQIERVQNGNRDHLTRMAKHLPIQNARTCGVVAAFEIDSAVQGYGAGVSEAITRAALENGVFLRPLGNTVYLLPPYCSSEEDLAIAWVAIDQAVKLSLQQPSS